MSKYIIYGHDGSGNHGCEALVRTTVKLLESNPDNIYLVSKRPDEDCHYGLNNLCQVTKQGEGEVNRASLEFLKAYWNLKVHKDWWPIMAHCQLNNVHAQKGDVCLSIGGDTYCYGGEKQLIREHSMWRSRGSKTVYWGCSIEPDLLKNDHIAEDIARFDLITARESISYEALKKVNPHTILVADPAFLLDAADISLPDGFDGRDLVGINISPLICKSEQYAGITIENYHRLVEYILDCTDMKILLVPHVIWSHDDDRIILTKLYEKYKHSERIYMLPDSSCEQLKGYISQCRFFIGARTHATIAAYSTGVPTLVVGYSVKSRGIARDLFGTEKNYVLPVQELEKENDLTRAFCWILKNEQKIKEHLQSVLPEYKKRACLGAEAMKKL